MAIARIPSNLPPLSGKVGGLVYLTNENGEAAARQYVVPANPRTPAQMKARYTLRGVTMLWGELTDEQRAAWNLYARAEGRTGYRAFVGLATKWRTVNGNGMPPVMPPTEVFFGDSVGLSVAAGLTGSGGIVVAAQRPNQPGVVVEIKVQRLRAVHVGTKPRNWVTKSFVAFAEGSLSSTLALLPGAYAVGYRYVNAASGQETTMAVLGKVTVTP